MGQLGTTLRAALVSTGSAVEAVTLLGAGPARWTLPGEVATIAVAVLDPVTGVVEHVSLGHPPLLVVAPDGTTQLDPRARSCPRSASWTACRPRSTSRCRPAARSCCTANGLVERREESILDGLRRLAAFFAAEPGTVDVDGVVAAARDPRSADDATLLLVRRDA